jgi:amidase
MPIGLQVHARHGADAALLAAGRCLEDALGDVSSLAPLGA